MRTGHEDCAHETVEDKSLCDLDPRTTIICLHDHREPVTATDGIDTITVGWHCHCCGRVWTDRNYITGGQA